MAEAGRKVRIRDVADAAEVSYASAQYVLSGKKSARISDAVRTRILETAAAMGYKLDVLGAALKRGYLDMIIIVVSGTRIRGGTVDLFMELTRNSAIANLPTAVYVAGSHQETVDMFQRAIDLQPFGILMMWDAFDAAHEYMLQAKQAGTPMVSLYPYGGADILSVTSDRIQAFRDGVLHLAALGHRKIAFLPGADMTGATSVAKYAGYCEGLKKAGISLDTGLIQTSSEASFPGGVEAVKELMNRRPDVTAIVAVNDPLAIGAIRGAQNMGLRVPHDLSIVGWGATEEGLYCDPPLTTVKDNPAEIARLAVLVLRNLRLQPQLPSNSHTIPTELVVRGSTGPVAISKI
ncbi:MAG: LacI family DNA-binding transcriptional regulator [Armatimonadota bacterium]